MAQAINPNILHMEASYMHLTLNSTKFQIQEGSGGGGVCVTFRPP